MTGDFLRNAKAREVVDDADDGYPFQMSMFIDLGSVEEVGQGVSQIGKLEPINGQPVILKITVNGIEHQMLLENRRRSRKFAQDTYTLTGRSQTALLAAPSAPLRSLLQENVRTSVQL